MRIARHDYLSAALRDFVAVDAFTRLSARLAPQMITSSPPIVLYTNLGSETFIWCRRADQLESILTSLPISAIVRVGVQVARRDRISLIVAVVLLFLCLLLGLDNLLTDLDSMFFDHVHVGLQFVQAHGPLEVLIAVATVFVEFCVAASQCIIDTITYIHCSGGVRRKSAIKILFIIY